MKKKKILERKVKKRMLRAIKEDKQNLEKFVDKYFDYICFTDKLKGTKELKAVIVYCLKNNIYDFKLMDLYTDISKIVNNNIINIEKNIRMALGVYALNARAEGNSLYKDVISQDENKVTAKKFVRQTLKILRELLEDL